MTQEEKQLLLKDLCARLPYGVKFSCKDIKGIWTLTGISKVKDDEYICFPGLPNLAVIIPYLRPMSSMTEKEKEELWFLGEDDFEVVRKWYKEESIKETGTPSPVGFRKVDYCNKHHFDYRGLIPMGLALEAPEGMYKTE